MRNLLRAVSAFLHEQGIALPDGTLLFFGSIAAVSVALLLFVLINDLRLAARDKRLNRDVFRDAASSALTFIAVGCIGAAIVPPIMLFYAWLQEHIGLFEIPTTFASSLAALLLADFAYYWEHRMSHRMHLFWASHTVHHSETRLNIATSLRTGPLYEPIARLFQIPLIVLGFDPVLIASSVGIILLYQSWIHTEYCGRLGPLEFILNTPSHHRVHHGSNTEYLDKNYGGLLIIWDRLFGTFEQESAPVVYGLTKPLGSTNFLPVFTHGLRRLWQRLRLLSPGAAVKALFSPPA